MLPFVVMLSFGLVLNAMVLLFSILGCKPTPAARKHIAYPLLLLARLACFGNLMVVVWLTYMSPDEPLFIFLALHLLKASVVAFIIPVATLAFSLWVITISHHTQPAHRSV